MRFARSSPRHLRPVVATGLAFVLVVTLAARSAAADVAEWIPADALVVFKINNVQRVNEEAKALLREFGVAEQNPAMGDPLAAFQQETGIREGLNLDGNFAIYVANDPQMDQEHPPFVLLIPVSDYDAFLRNFKGVRDEGGGITAVNMAEQGDDADGEADPGEEGQEDEGEGEADESDMAYIMKMGEYAGMTPKKELLRKPEQAIRFAGITAEQLEQRDAVLYANFSQLGPMLAQKLREENVREQARQEMMEGDEAQGMPENLKPLFSAILDQGFNVVESFLRDAEGATITLDLDDGGIGFGWAAQFKPGSYLATTFGQMKTAETEQMLTGLPEGNYIVFGGSAENREINQKLFDDLAGPVIQQLQQADDTGKLAELVEAIKTQITAAGESAFGMFAPSGPMGGSSIIQNVTIQGGDAQRLIEAQRKMAQLQPEVMSSLMGEQMQEMPMNVEAQWEEDAKQVGGVTFDKLTTKFTGAEQQGMDMGMRMLFGPDGPVTYLGQVDQKLLTINGLTDQQITSVVQAVRENRAPLAQNQGVRFVNGHLPERRSAVVYFQVDELIRSGLGYARQFGQNIPVQLPEDLPPVGFAAGPAENAIQGAMFLPKDLINALIVAGLQAQQHFGGEMDDDGL